MEVKIKFFDNEIYSDFLDVLDRGNWIDLRSREDIVLKKGESYIIKLGVAMKLPKNYEAIVAPRSSTFKKWGIIQTNHIGVIDEEYCGNEDEWCMPVYALRDTEIKRGDRICQFRLLKRQELPLFEIVDKLEDENRGGFGSTGIV